MWGSQNMWCIEPAHACRHNLQWHLPMYRLILTVYQTVLKSAVWGTDHWIHITKKNMWCLSSAKADTRMRERPLSSLRRRWDNCKYDYSSWVSIKGASQKLAWRQNVPEFHLSIIPDASTAATSFVWTLVVLCIQIMRLSNSLLSYFAKLFVIW